MQLNEFYLLFKDIDCKSCGYENCRTFARRLILGKAKLSDCANLLPGIKEKIENALKEGVTFSRVPPGAEAHAIIIRPCQAKGKTMGEIRLPDKNKLFPLFDSKALYEIAKKEKALSSISYSEELGFLRASLGEKNIFIFENGLVRVKQADSKADVEKTVEFIRGLISRAEICEECGGTKSECRTIFRCGAE